MSEAAPSAPVPTVFVCILNWNKPNDTLACIGSLQAQDYPNLRIVVVDNASTDASIPALRALVPRIDLIENPRNLGFTGGCNAAIRHALAHGADYVWLLNNDAGCSPETLSRLIAYAESSPEIGMVSPIITDRGSGQDNYAVGRLDLATGTFDQTVDAATAEAMQQRHPHQIMLKGTALLIKKALLKQIGLLDDRFFAYCEDNDYSVRCNAAGFRAACVTTARVYHDEGQPDGGWRKPYAYYYAVRNGILFWRKHAVGLAAWRYARWHVCTIFRLLGRTGFGAEETAAFADGLWSGLRGATGRWDPSNPRHRMPRPLRRLLVARPGLCLALAEGKLRVAFLAQRSGAARKDR